MLGLELDVGALQLPSRLGNPVTGDLKPSDFQERALSRSEHPSSGTGNYSRNTAWDNGSRAQNESDSERSSEKGQGARGGHGCDAPTGGRTLPEARGQATTPPSSRGSPATILRNPGKPPGSSPGLGRSHMPRSGWAREPQLLSLRVWSLCPATGGASIVKGPRTAKKSGPRTAMKSGPHLPQDRKSVV